MVLPPQRHGSTGAPEPVERVRSPEPAPQPLTREAPRSDRTVVTLALVIVNVAVLGLMVANGVSAIAPDVPSLVQWGANYGPLTLRGEWWRLISSCFVHGGLIHLGFNMYVLWDVGRITERVYGSLGFALVYLVSGIGGSLASVQMNPTVTSVGASGAVFGVVGVFFAFLLLNRQRIDPALGKHLRRSLITFVVINVAIGFSIPGIDQSAHVGGLVTGFGMGLVAAPRVGAAGLERPYARYPLVVAVGVAMCAVAWRGLLLLS